MAVFASAAAGMAAMGEAVLTVRAAGESHSLAAGEVTEIVRGRTWTRVPHAPPSLLGLVNLRGRLLPIISLAVMLGRQRAEPSATSRVIVVERGSRFGLQVDEVVALGRASPAMLLDLDPLLARDFAGLLSPRSSHAPGEAEPTAPEAVAEMEELRLVGVVIAGQEYGLPVEQVTEVIALPREFTKLPRIDQAMLGVMGRRRGGLLPLVSLRVLLGFAQQMPDGRSARVVVTQFGHLPVGLVVDSLTAILRVPRHSIDPVPRMLNRGGRAEAQIEAICRLEGGRRLVSILSASTLFDSGTVARLHAETKNSTEQMSGPQTNAAQIEKFVLFHLGDEHYGLPIDAVDEVVRRPGNLTRIPRAPAFIDGVMNWRGRVIPVIDQRRRFAASGDAAKGGRIVVVTTHGLQAGFAVDAVSEVIGVLASELKPAPDLTADGAQVFDRVAIERDGRMILLIDPKALLALAEREILVALGNAAPGADHVGADAVGAEAVGAEDTGADAGA